MLKCQLRTYLFWWRQVYKCECTNANFNNCRFKKCDLTNMNALAQFLIMRWYMVKNLRCNARKRSNNNLSEITWKWNERDILTNCSCVKTTFNWADLSERIAKRWTLARLIFQTLFFLTCHDERHETLPYRPF